MDQEQLLPVCWSGEVVDHRYVDEVTEQMMESTGSQLTTTGQCPEYGCNFSSCIYARQLHHVEVHMVLFICNCVCVSSHWDTTTKHTRKLHLADRAPVVQTDRENWASAGALYQGYHLRCPSCLLGQTIISKIACQQRRTLSRARSATRRVCSFLRRTSNVKDRILCTQIEAKIRHTEVELGVKTQKG